MGCGSQANGVMFPGRVRLSLLHHTCCQGSGGKPAATGLTQLPRSQQPEGPVSLPPCSLNSTECIIRQPVSRAISLQLRKQSQLTVPWLSCGACGRKPPPSEGFVDSPGFSVLAGVPLLLNTCPKAACLHNQLPSECFRQALHSGQGLFLDREAEKYQIKMTCKYWKIICGLYAGGWKQTRNCSSGSPLECSCDRLDYREMHKK
ncbi:uncharacterized protein LOC129059215 [Pongo abelii]|uniref:uncharacterized protein LOC129059215 n=1 Tax=Pongo abelii TaxID=9601 RepID=UPI0023E85E53|nr:uncharacterized protein LOC129059215 [Pongo abelii]